MKTLTTFYRVRLLSFLLFIFVASDACLARSCQEGETKKSEISRFLTSLACAEAEAWPALIKSLKTDFPQLVMQSTGKTLSCLHEAILKSDDLKMIKLYQRAVRNHDTLSREKAEPFTFYYKHYEAPPFFVPFIHLTIDVSEGRVQVISDLKVKRNGEERELILDGREQKVCEVIINGKRQEKEKYQVTPHELILLEAPEEEYFDVRITSEINPFDNDTLEGMYQCGKWLTTQCESEGARRIFFTLDRPDVLSKITTTIIANKESYPYRLSNGDLIEEKKLEDGRWSITWQDPFPKPSYLFACVLGGFSQLKSNFTTKSGKDVELQIYVEPGKESRAGYALYALRKAMEFDEIFFDREYDLSCLKMVGIPDFNSGAMENKGLMIFNDVRLLVDAQSGTDRTHREVAAVVGHEYFHNWSGNRVTIRNWFEIALKEAFTDLRAVLFSEWLFGSGFVRPKAVVALRESQFPEEISEKGHAIIVESYVDAHAIYDATTYTKGREVFRALKNYIDLLIPGGFREVQNLYFSRYDGQAVTFRELLCAAKEVLSGHGHDLKNFERWFHQQGTPIVKAQLAYDSEQEIAEITFVQSCRHPKSGMLQQPLQIPCSLELLDSNGSVIQPKFSFVLENELTSFKFASSVKPTPLFMHGYPAPVILDYDYTMEDLATIVKGSDDAFCRWDAGQKYSIFALKEMIGRMERDANLELKALNGEPVFADLLQLYMQVLKNPVISPLAKAQVLEIPSLRAIAQAFNRYDFDYLSQCRHLFIFQLAHLCKPALEEMLETYPAPTHYEPCPEHMQIRELRNACYSLLVNIDKKYEKVIFERYQQAANFDDAASSFQLCLKIGNPYKQQAVDDFYRRWKDDKAVFNFWLTSQSSTEDCTIKDLQGLASVKGYDAKNPNHVRSILRTYIANLKCYHQPSGEGYRFVADKIIEIAQFNPFLAHNYIAVPAFLDFEKLPVPQRELMAQELERLRAHDAVPPQTRDLIEKMLQKWRK